MKNLRNEKGITLVALVVTIIVLLILAGVSLSLVAGGDGIIAKASNAVSDTNLQTAKEAAQLAVTDKIAEYYDKIFVQKSNTTSDTGYGNVGAYLATVFTGAKNASGYGILVVGDKIYVNENADATATAKIVSGTVDTSTGAISWN